MVNSHRESVIEAPISLSTLCSLSTHLSPSNLFCSLWPNPSFWNTAFRCYCPAHNPVCGSSLSKESPLECSAFSIWHGCWLYNSRGRHSHCVLYDWLRSVGGAVQCSRPVWLGRCNELYMCYFIYSYKLPLILISRWGNWNLEWVAFQGS